MGVVPDAEDLGHFPSVFVLGVHVPIHLQLLQPVVVLEFLTQFFVHNNILSTLEPFKISTHTLWRVYNKSLIMIPHIPAYYQQHPNTGPENHSHAPLLPPLHHPSF